MFGKARPSGSGASPSQSSLSNHVLSIVAADRAGLLYAMARVLADHKINLHSARINTLGDRAEDVFLLSGDTHFGEVNENVRPYSAGRHRHTPEMQQAFIASAGADETVWFTPHLIPMTRGILATCYLRTASGVSQADAEEAYRRRYAGCPFVRVLTDKLPESKATQGSNFCDVAVLTAPADRLLIAFAALDNLVKGAAGQAVQCMNLMFGLPQEEGLWAPPLYP